MEAEARTPTRWGCVWPRVVMPELKLLILPWLGVSKYDFMWDELWAQTYHGGEALFAGHKGPGGPGVWFCCDPGGKLSDYTEPPESCVLKSFSPSNSKKRACQIR